MDERNGTNSQGFTAPENWQPEPWMALHPEITAEQWRAYRQQMSPREWEEYCDKWRAYDRARSAPQPYVQPYGAYAAPYRAARPSRAGAVFHAIWPCLVFFAASMLLGVLVGVVMVFSGLTNGVDFYQMIRVSTYLSIALQAVLIPVYYGVFRRDRRKEREAGLETGGRTGMSVLLGVIAAVGLFFVTDGLLTLLMEVLPRGIVEQYNEQMEQTMGILSGLEWLAAISVVLLAPFMEELMMRGLVQKRLQAVMPKGAALLVAAALFGLLHMNPIQSTYAFLLGLFLGWTYQRSGRLCVPIMGHLAFNGMNYVYGMLYGLVEANPDWFGVEVYRHIVDHSTLYVVIAALAGALLALLALALFYRLHAGRDGEHGEVMG